jgi:NADPH:quinone reductase-like Zn-dependent oxidoreductase
MKTSVLQKATGLEALTLTEKPQPQPGDCEVLIQVRAVSLNYRDLLITQNRYGNSDFSGRIPFSDGAGQVIAVGKNVTRVQPGDRVAGIFMQTWLHGKYQAEYGASALGGAVDGMLAEYVTLHEDGVVLVPDYLSHEEAATLPCAAVTAWNALVVQCNARPGESVLIQGTGGVSMFALQFAKIMGLKVFMTSSSDEKLERLKAMGVDHTFNYKTDAQWGEKLLKLTNQHGVDHVIEVGGAGTLNQSLTLVAHSGNVAMIGVLTGLSAEVNTALILHKSICIHGIYVGSRDMFEAMNHALTLQQIHPVIDRTFSFEQAREALAYLESGKHFGKVVIRL